MKGPARTPLRVEVVWFFGVVLVAGALAIMGFGWFLAQFRTL